MAVNNLIDFYKDLLSIVNLSVSKDGTVFLKSKKIGNMPISINGKPMVLPSNENIKTSVEIIDGKTQIVKYLFNPAGESAIKGENKTLLRYREILERHVNNSFAIIGEVIFSILNSGNEINDPDLIMFVEMLNEYKAPGIKKIIDEKMLENWGKIYEQIVGLETNQLFMHNFLKRGGKIGNDKFNRIAVLTFPVYEQLNQLKKNDTYYGIKIRKKDIHAYKAFHRFVFNKSENDILAGIPFGSKNKIAPALHSLLMSYDYVKNMINGVINVLQKTKYDVDYLEEARLKDLPLPLSKIEKFLEKVQFEIKEIPNESDLLLAANTTGIESDTDVVNRVLGNNQLQQEQPKQNVPQNAPKSSSMSEEDETLAKILGNIQNQNTATYGTNTGYCQPVQQPVYSQPAMGYGMPQPTYGQPQGMPMGGYPQGYQQSTPPMGYNNPQPAYEQGYQQPQPQGTIVNQGMGYYR